MTRYEYAAIVFRALENGAFAYRDMSRLLAEFQPEIALIRADTIKKTGTAILLLNAYA